MADEAVRRLYNDQGEVIGEVRPTFDEHGIYIGETSTFTGPDGAVNTSFQPAPPEQVQEFRRAASAKAEASKGCVLPILVGVAVLIVAAAVFGNWFIDKKDPGAKVASSLGKVRLEQQQKGIADKLGEPAYSSGDLGEGIVIFNPMTLSKDTQVQDYFDAMMADFLDRTDIDTDDYMGRIEIRDLESCDIVWVISEKASGQDLATGHVIAVWLNESGPVKAAMFSYK